MSTFEVVLERDTANDESATVAMVLVPSGTSVVQDEPIFEIENSKATEEYVSPGTGVLMHDLVVGQRVNFGVVIARIVPVGRSAAADLPKPAALIPAPIVTAPAPPKLQGEGRFSRAAAALLLKYNLSASQFDADFVTTSDVLAHIQCQDELVSSVIQSASDPVPAPTPPAANAIAGSLIGHPVGQRKRAEIDVLSQGAGQTMLSVLGVSLGPLQVRRNPGNFLEGRITDLLLYEASRLMRKYPRLNAFYADGQIFLHEAVNAGLAIDDGNRLMVYGFERTDQAELGKIENGIADAVSRYVNGELTALELTRATFTVTDLSAGELDFVLPLLPRGQSCIVGVTLSLKEGYRLFAGFDHRVTEGREVMAFLGDLRERLLSFSSTSCKVVSGPVCAFCARSAAEAVTSSREKGLLKVAGANGDELLCCGSCWNGW